MTFDPTLSRKYLLELDLPSDRADKFEDALANRSLEGCASFILGTGIKCCMVGLLDAAHEMFPKARTFLQGAIEHNEIPRYYFPGGTEAARWSELALCEWLIDRKHDLDSLRQAVHWQEKWLSRPGRPDKSNVQACLTDYLDAQEYETLCRRFEATGLKEPRNLRQIRAEGTMCYVIARHRLGLQYSPAEVESAIHTFLKRNVPQWCNSGLVIILARWMKIAFWKPGDDPIGTLLKCYDYLPGIRPPNRL